MKFEEISRSLGRSSSSTGSSSGNRNSTACTNIINSSSNTTTASSSSSLSSPSSASRKILPASSGSKSTAGSLLSSLRLGSLSLSSSLSAARRRFSLPSLNSKAPSLGRKVTGTLFGSRKGHVTFAVQEDPAATHPAILVELATSTSSLVKEMSSGLVRIALECHKKKISTTTHTSAQSQSHNYNYNHNHKLLFSEPVWTMYCNGRKCGYATARACSESDFHVLATIRSVSVGAGVIPPSNSTDEGEEVLYMRARFERVVGSRDSEAFYMLNPDGNGGPDLSIFLLRL